MWGINDQDGHVIFESNLLSKAVIYFMKHDKEIDNSYDVVYSSDSGTIVVQALVFYEFWVSHFANNETPNIEKFIADFVERF